MVLFSSIPGPLQTVQRAELWRVILSLQAFFPVYIGIDNLNVPNVVADVAGLRLRLLRLKVMRRRKWWLMVWSGGKIRMDMMILVAKENLNR